MDNPERTQRQQSLRERLKWLIACRLAIAAVFVIATLILRPGSDGPTEFAFVTYLFITGTHLVVAIVFGLFYEATSLRLLGIVAYTQIFWDLFFTTALIYITGGVDSPFTVFYWLSIFNASVLFFKKGAYTAAFVSSLLYGALIDLEYLQWIPTHLGPLGIASSWNEQKVMASIVMHTCGFFVIAYFSSYVSIRAREAETKLKEKKRRFGRFRSFDAPNRRKFNQWFSDVEWGRKM